MRKKLTRLPFIYWIISSFLVFVLLIVPVVYVAHVKYTVPLTYVVHDWIMAESYNYWLADEMHKVAKELKEYKSKNDKYPQTLSQLRSTDDLCKESLGRSKCTKILYKPSKDLQDFKMAIDTHPVSGAWPILFYDPKFSLTMEEQKKLSSEELESIQKKYGVACWFCAAYSSQELKQAYYAEDKTPVYKKDKKLFSNPQEWPDLPTSQ